MGEDSSGVGTGADEETRRDGPSAGGTKEEVVAAAERGLYPRGFEAHLERVYPSDESRGPHP